MKTGGTPPRSIRILQASSALALVLCLISAGTAIAAEEAGGTAPQPNTPAGTKAKWLSGRYDTTLDTAFDDDDSDIDLTQTLRLEVTPPEHPRLRIKGLAWMNAELGSDVDADSALRDINDASDSDVRLRLMDLYVEYDDLFGDSTLRVGRQRILENLTTLRVDGLFYKQKMKGWDWYVFGGARASLYYDSHDDLALGAGASWMPSPRTRLALDAFYAEEDHDDVYRPFVADLFGLDYPRKVSTDLDDSLISLSAWHRLTENFNVFGRLNLKDGDVDDLVLRATGFVPSWELTYEIDYRARLHDAEDRVNDITEYYRVIGYYEKYQNFLVAVHKPLSEKMTLSLEGELRDSDEADWMTGNRDYQRFAITTDWDELAKDTDVSVGLEYWNVTDGEGVWAITSEATKTWNNLRLTVGTGFERYEDRFIEYNPWPNRINLALVAFVPGYFMTYNPLVFGLDTWTVETHENIYSVYSRIQWKFKENQELNAGITYEKDDGPDSPYWRIQAGYGIRF